jgi:NADH dehydrogenase/NADH:ubiquinone oxidoreductase subunit G
MPDRGPGAAKVKQAGKSYKDMKTGMKALYLAGNMMHKDFKSDFIIVQASHVTPLTERADVVLPMTAFYENEGTIVNTYGMMKTVARAQQPAGQAKDGTAIISEISAAMSKTKAFQEKDIIAAVKKVKAGKLTAGSINPVKAMAAAPYSISSTALLATMHQGLLSRSAVAQVMVVNEVALQGSDAKK